MSLRDRGGRGVAVSGRDLRRGAEHDSPALPAAGGTACPWPYQHRPPAEWDGALLREARRSFPFLERIIADAGYQGQKMNAVVARMVRGCSRSCAAVTGIASWCSRSGGLSNER